MMSPSGVKCLLVGDGKQEIYTRLVTSNSFYLKCPLQAFKSFPKKLKKWVYSLYTTPQTTEKDAGSIAWMGVNSRHCDPVR
jgi:hypothetical protein